MTRLDEWSHSIEQVYDWLNQAIRTPKHCIRFPSVTTVHNGVPHTRTLVLRDLDGANFIFVTDNRSQKVRQLNINPHACMHCYDPQSRLQIKVLGVLKPIDNHPKLPEWTEMGLERYTDYGAELAPGHHFPSEPFSNTLELAQSHFLPLVLVPNHLEFLQLNRKAHLRIQWTLCDHSWKRMRVVP